MNLMIKKNNKIIDKSEGEFEFIGQGYYTEEFYSTLYNHPQYWIKNKNGDIIGNRSFRFVKLVKNQTIIVTTLNFKMELIDLKGNILYKFREDTFDVFSNDNKTFTVKTKDNNFYVLNERYEEIISETKYELSSVYEDTLVYKCDEKFGLMDITGKILTKPVYDKIGNYMGKLFRYKNMIIAEKDKKYGCIDRNGNVVIEFKYDCIYYPYEKHICVKINDEIQLLNYDGSIFLEDKNAYSFTEYDNGLIGVITKDNKYYMLNSKKEKICNESNQISIPIYNSDQKKVIPKWFYFQANNNKYGIKLSDGNLLHKPNLDKILSYNQNIIIARKGSVDLLIYIDGSEIELDTQYEYYDFYKNGLCCVGKDYLYGFIDEQGDLIIDIQYSDCGNFENGLCIVEE